MDAGLTQFVVFVVSTSCNFRYPILYLPSMSCFSLLNLSWRQHAFALAFCNSLTCSSIIASLKDFNPIWTEPFANLERLGAKIPPPNLAISSQMTMKL